MSSCSFQSEAEMMKSGDVNAEADAKERQETEAAEREVTSLKNEKELLRQDFLLHPEIKVWQFLQEHDTEILDFVRFEVGETARE